MRKLLQKTFHNTAKKARQFVTNQKLKRAIYKEQIRKIPTHYDRALIEWEAPQEIRFEKGRIWYIVFTLITALFTAYAIFNKDYLFAAAIILFAVTYILIQRKKPETTKIIISHNGIKIGSEVFPFHQIRAFWIIYEPPYVQTFNIRTGKRFMPDITVSLEDQNPAIIRHVLGHFIPEWQDRQETFSETLIRLLRL